MRRVEDITEALWGSKVSPGTISNLNKKAYEHNITSEVLIDELYHKITQKSTRVCHL